MVQNILAVALLFLTSVTFAQNLEAILSDTKLPVPRFGMSVVYDGEDSIYILGGWGSDGVRQEILKFSVTTQTLEKVGTMDPLVYGSAVWTGNGGILYFGGDDGWQNLWKVWSYKPEDASGWIQIGELPTRAISTSSVWDQGEYSYIFGGLDHNQPLSTILRYSSDTNTTIVVGHLPGPTHSTSAVWDEATGDAYIFGGFSSGYLKDIVKFNPTENIVVKLNVTLPSAIYDSCAVWTGKKAYMGPGFDGNFMRFDLSTNEVLNVPVTNLPPYLESHGCAFVKKLNRIYLFGGLDGVSYGRDEIMYIDLTPSSTTTTLITSTTTTPITTTTQEPGNPVDCNNNEADGTRFPDPYCCKSFYQCENREAVPRQCPSQLHFNPSHSECDLPEIVKCRSVYG